MSQQVEESQPVEKSWPHATFIDAAKARMPANTEDTQINKVALNDYYDKLYNDFLRGRTPELITQLMINHYFDDNFDIFKDKINYNRLYSRNSELVAKRWWEDSHNVRGGGKRKRTKKSKSRTKKSKRKTRKYKK
jgi:hypothetical protein